MSAQVEQRNQDATCYVGNLDERIQEELLWEMMLQAGPVVNVFMPKDKISGKYLGYGFVEYRSEDDADYAIKIMNMIKVYGKPIKVNKASADKKQVEVGANIFIGNLDPDVDEKLLFDTFSAFGGILQTPKILCDAESGSSKGFGFVSFDSFEASDLAIECMNGQYLCNRPIIVQYAFKKDTPGERHGSQAERILAASQPSSRVRPNAHFSSGGEGGMTSMVGMGVNSLVAYQHQQQMEMQQQMMNMQQFNPMMMQQHAALSMYGGAAVPPMMSMMPPMSGGMMAGMMPGMMPPMGGMPYMGGGAGGGMMPPMPPMPHMAHQPIMAPPPPPPMSAYPTIPPPPMNFSMPPPPPPPPM